MKPRILLLCFVVVFAVVPLLYLAMIYPRLPETVSMHFGLKGKADGFGRKSSAWLSTAGFGLVSLIVCLICLFISRIDPRQATAAAQATQNKIALVLAVFMCILNCYMIYSLPKQQLPVSGLYIIICMLLTLLGNFMNNLKPNYFVGIRTPWTLESETNWRKTHHLGSKLWFVGGMVMALLLLLVPEQASRPVFITGVIILALVPTVYSFLLFKNKKTDNQGL